MLHHRLRATAGFSAGGGIPTDGLVLHYTMDNIIGATLVDETGNSNATLINIPTVISGIKGNALSFNGTNQRADASTLASFSSGITIACRVKFRSSGAHYVFSKRNGGTGNDIQLGKVSTDKPSVLFWGLNVVSLTHTQSASTGVWHYLEASYNGSQGTIVLDDSVHTEARSGIISNSTNTFKLAEDWFSSYAAIDLDTLLIYDRAITPEERAIIKGLI